MLTAKQERFRKMTPEESLIYKEALRKLYKPTGRLIKIG